MTLIQRFTARDLQIGGNKTASQCHAVELGSDAVEPGGGPWPRGAQAAQAQKKPTPRARNGGGGHWKVAKMMKNDTHTSISHSCFADREKKQQPVSVTPSNRKCKSRWRNWILNEKILRMRKNDTHNIDFPLVIC